MKIIVSVDKNWSIGYQGQLHVTIPQDQRLFREETMGKVVVMGRKTFESLPGKQPLYGRTNIILSRDSNYKVKGALVCGSISEALKELGKYPEEDCFIIGGQSVYEQFYPYCNVAHVTYIDYTYNGDTCFPDLDKDPLWEIAAESDEQTYFDLCYTFRLYLKKG